MIQIYLILIPVILAPYFYAGFVFPPALAFESSSAGFEIHAGDAESIVGSSSSSSFGTRSAGGQHTTGIATNIKQVFSGILYWLFGSFKQQYEQIHFRWRNDSAGCSESSTTCWAAAEDTALSGNTFSPLRLRFEISNEGWTRGPGQQFRIEYSQGSDCAAGTYAAVPTDTSLHWRIIDSANITDGEQTTNFSGSLTDENAVFRAGQVKDAGNTTASITVTSENFTEVEYNLATTTNAVGGATYCFRLTDAGSVANYVYTRYASITLLGGLPSTGDLISPTFDTYAVNGANFNWIKWSGTKPSGTRVRLQIAVSDNSSGPWTYYGEAGGACGTGLYYEPAVDTSAEIQYCNATFNNKRYYRYKVQLCSNNDCATSGTQTPTVNDVVINWSP